MRLPRSKTTIVAAAALSTLTLSSVALAYDEDDAIRDCNKRMRSEYSLTDFRSESAKKLPGEGHPFEVKGKTKVKGDKYDYSCDIKDRAVVAIRYDGPKPEGLGGAEKLAIGAAAAVATGLAVSAMTKDKPAKEAAPAAPEPEVTTLSGGAMEVKVSSDCTVKFNDIGMRDSHSSGCTKAQLSAANKAVTKELGSNRANATP
jgi:hypothetical protein